MEKLRSKPPQELCSEEAEGLPSFGTPDSSFAAGTPFLND